MKLSILLIVLSISTQGLFAQKDKEEGRFTASIIAGVSFSQIDGDDDASYSKVGVNVGARGGVRFGQKMELCTEILFSQKGSAINDRGVVFHLDYLEVPVLFYYKDWETTDSKNRKFRRVMIGAGFSYSRLVNAAIFRNNQWENPENTPNFQDPFEKNDFMFMFDANFLFTRNFGVNLRWGRSILSIVAPNSTLRSNPNPNEPTPKAFSHSVVLRVFYKF
jgi:hypothetical protein